jgi:hypothetical protein
MRAHQRLGALAIAGAVKPWAMGTCVPAQGHELAGIGQPVGIGAAGGARRKLPRTAGTRPSRGQWGRGWRALAGLARYRSTCARTGGGGWGSRPSWRGPGQPPRHWEREPKALLRGCCTQPTPNGSNGRRRAEKAIGAGGGARGAQGCRARAVSQADKRWDEGPGQTAGQAACAGVQGGAGWPGSPPGGGKLSRVGEGLAVPSAADSGHQAVAGQGSAGRGRGGRQAAGRLGRALGRG